MTGKSQQKQIHSGVEGTDFPQTPFLLFTKERKKHNILVGEDPGQVLFMEVATGLTVSKVLAVADEDILGKEEPLLFQVENLHNIHLSPVVKANVGIWSLTPLVKGSAGVTKLIKHGMSVLHMERLQKGALDQANDMLVDMFPSDSGPAYIQDVRAGICAALWVLTGDIPTEKPPFWKQPWEAPYGWMPRGVNPIFRLNALYREVVAWTYAHKGDLESCRMFGVSPAKRMRLSRMKLDIDKMDSTTCVLSAWKTERSDPLVVALKISQIWGRRG